MSLSNTAVPYYYGQFREAVLRGDIPVNKRIEKQMQRIDALIEDPRYYYDDRAVLGWIQFCERELTLTDGGDVEMLPSFKLWGEDLLGWYYFIEQDVYVPGDHLHPGHYEKRRKKKRLRNKQFLIISRSAAKSMYAHFVQSFNLCTSDKTSHQITTAPTMKQAEEVIAPFRTAITRAKGPLLKFLTAGSIRNTKGSKESQVQLASTKKGIENFLTGSLLEIRPMSIAKLQGLQLAVSSVDEWLSGDIREDVLGAIEQGAAKVDDYIILAISSEGTVRNGVGDTIKMELDSILNGDYINDHVSIWWYQLDSMEEIADPFLWMKANPNIGRTVSYETYQLEVERAEKVPSARNDILAKRFGIAVEGFTYFFAYEDTLPFPKKSFSQLPCAMGADMSRGDDFCSFVFMFPFTDGTFGIRTRNYITERTLSRLGAAARAKYQEFMDEGSLIVMQGNVLEMMDIYEDLDRFIIENDFEVRCFGYDPYNAKAFVDRWCAENSPFGVMKVIQGRQTESVPLGELNILAQDRCLIFDEQIMSFAMGNAIVLKDVNGNQQLYKERNSQKIDPVAAMMDAYIAFKANPDLFD